MLYIDHISTKLGRGEEMLRVVDGGAEVSLEGEKRVRESAEKKQSLPFRADWETSYRKIT